MRPSAIRVGAEGAVTVVTLSGGALTRRAALELDEVLDALADERSARVVVLDGGGADFCPGAGDDLDPLTAGVDPPARLAALGVPVVAAVDGACRSVGLELALAADIRIAGPGARFGFPEVAEGRLPAWGGTQRLPRVAGAAAATAMLLLGDELDAEAALGRGLVHDIAADPAAHARGLAAALAGRGPLALEYAKEAVRRGVELPLHHALRLEADFNHLLATSSDRAEGLRAFFDKRPPSFEGR